MATELRAIDGLRHEHIVIEATHGPAQKIVVENWPERVHLTRHLMQQGVRSIRQASLDVEIIDGVRLCGQVDELVRVALSSSLGAWSYEPIEIKQHQEPDASDRLQLGLYREMLSTILDMVPAGELWLGTTDDSTPARRLRITDPVGRAKSQWQQLIDLLTSTEPPIWFVKPCVYCAWQQHCEETAVAQGDLAILPNLHPTTARQLRKDGYTSVHEIAAMDLQGLQRYPYVGKQGTRLHAGATALSERKPVFLSRDQRSFTEALEWSAPTADFSNKPPLFLDLETHGYDPWGFGFATCAEDLRIVLVAPPAMQDRQQHVMIHGIPVDFVPTALSGWQMVMTASRQAGGPVIHWSQHEPKCLERSANVDIQQELTSRLLDAYTLMNESVVLPIPRRASAPAAGIKTISRYLGIDRETGPDHWSIAESAYLGWYHSLQPGAERATVDMLEPVVAYLRADVLGLARIWQWFNEQLRAVSQESTHSRA